jgi:hypothetical protein
MNDIRCLCCCLASVAACLGGASRAYAQPPLPTTAVAPASTDFLTHYNFHLSADALATNDPRFSWQTHFGGDLDLVDYVAGRMNILVDYEAILGHEQRLFDPNQGTYTLESSVSVRAGATEIAGVLHHVSRHLSDRPKRFPIAWNVLAVRALRRFEAARSTIDAQVGAGRVTERVFVDYRWTGNVDLVARRPVTARVGVFAHVLSDVFLVDRALAGRDAQTEGRLEGGVRLIGHGGAVELFAGIERRIDADPLDRQAQRWAFAGFRFVSQ